MTNPLMIVFSRLDLSGEDPQRRRKRQYGNYRLPHVRISCRGDKTGDRKVDPSLPAGQGRGPDLGRLRHLAEADAVALMD
jgi:hypothetical protein